VRPSIRFEVFKRDGFACQYCGRTVPDVILELDHILPKAEGGGDEITNLITACWDCNRGKGATLLDDRAPVLDLETQTEVIREREAQIRAYNEIKAAERSRQQDEYDEVLGYWYEVWGETHLERWHLPWANVLRRYIEEIGPSGVMDAMDVTRARFPNTITANAVRYFVGVLRGKAAGR
jgi:hypothetical protein